MAAISITAASVRRSTGQLLIGIVGTGADMTAGQYIYEDTSTQPTTVYLSDANGAAATRACNGVTLCNAAQGQPIVYTKSDPALVTGGTLTAGKPAFIAETAGSISVTPGDLTTGDTLITVGNVNTALTLNFSPLSGGVL